VVNVDWQAKRLDVALTRKQIVGRFIAMPSSSEYASYS